jgi:hypothetical protein
MKNLSLLTMKDVREKKLKILNNINLVILMNSMFLGLTISTWYVNSFSK